MSVPPSATRAFTAAGTGATSLPWAAMSRSSQGLPENGSTMNRSACVGWIRKRRAVVGSNRAGQQRRRGRGPWPARRARVRTTPPRNVRALARACSPARSSGTSDVLGPGKGSQHRDVEGKAGVGLRGRGGDEPQAARAHQLHQLRRAHRAVDQAQLLGDAAPHRQHHRRGQNRGLMFEPAGMIAEVDPAAVRRPHRIERQIRLL